MRKFLLWLSFLGKVFNSIGSAFEPILPAWDAHRAKLKEIEDKETFELEKDLNIPTEISQPVATVKGVVSDINIIKTVANGL